MSKKINIELTEHQATALLLALTEYSNGKTEVSKEDAKLFKSVLNSIKKNYPNVEKFESLFKD